MVKSSLRFLRPLRDLRGKKSKKGVSAMAIEQSDADDKSVNSAFIFVIRLTCLIIAITIGLEWRTFLPGFRHSLLTLVPLYDPLAQLPDSVNWGMLFFCGAMLALLWVFPFKRLPALGVTISLLFWGAQDIVRFQPWFHMYCFVTFAAAVCNDRRQALDACKIMVCGVYFWAGFHKMNLTFVTEIMPWVLGPFYNPSLDWLFTLAGYMTPVFEASIGVLLFFPRYRKLATLMAVTMLAVVLICLGPLGRNWGKVIPLWNIWLFMMEFRLFMGIPSGLKAFNFRWLTALSAIMFLMAPAIAIFKPDYARLGFKVFSGNTLTAEILIAPEERFKGQSKLFRGMRKEADRLAFKIPIYHSEYAYLKRSEAIYAHLDHPAQAKLRIYYPPKFYSTEREYRDISLGQDGR